MATADYYVSKDGTHWNIRFGDRDFACNTKTIALKAAVNAAHVAGGRGYRSQVLVRGRDGEWRTRWMFGIDRHPL
jgi:hypothetical protein